MMVCVGEHVLLCECDSVVLHSHQGPSWCQFKCQFQGSEFEHTDDSFLETNRVLGDPLRGWQLDGCV